MKKVREEVIRLTKEMEDTKSSFVGMKDENSKLQELLEEKERHTREKKTLEHDLTLLHRNLDVESKFSNELALENHRLQD